MSASVRLEEWALFRSGAAAVLGWRVGVPSDAFRQLTFTEAAAKIDALGLSSIAGSGTQKFSQEIPKALDGKLFPNEVTAVGDRLAALNMRMPAYFAGAIGADEAAARKLFELARSLRAEIIIARPAPETLPVLDRLANEFGINVALQNGSRAQTPAYWDPQGLLRAVGGLSNRVGAAPDIGAWLAEGVKPLEGLAALQGKLMAIRLGDRSAAGAGGRNVTLGTGVAGLPEIIAELYRLEAKPLFLSVDASGAGDPSTDLSRALENLDKALHPVMAKEVNKISKTAAIRGPDRLPPEERQKIEAALPQTAPAKPKKPRKLLVLDLNVAYGGHRSIPHANLALELLGKNTGAFEPVFDNNLDNLKYDKIKQFDAIYLNNTVGMIFVDPEVREGLTRFVREGGGLIGNHGVSHASMDWPEFGEMIGTKWGVHREPTEQATVRIEDPNSPVTAAFGGKEFVHQDEYFRFPIGPYSREKLHVLLTMDVEKTDMNQGRPCNKPCTRPDQDYAVSWIRSYGQGRVFFCILGHNPTIYMTPELARFFLAGIQFALGDLEADTTPSARLASTRN